MLCRPWTRFSANSSARPSKRLTHQSSSPTRRPCRNGRTRTAPCSTTGTMSRGRYVRISCTPPRTVAPSSQGDISLSLHLLRVLPAPISQKGRGEGEGGVSSPYTFCAFLRGHTRAPHAMESVHRARICTREDRLCTRGALLPIRLFARTAFICAGAHSPEGREGARAPWDPSRVCGRMRYVRIFPPCRFVHASALTTPMPRGKQLRFSPVRSYERWLAVSSHEGREHVRSGTQHRP